MGTHDRLEDARTEYEVSRKRTQLMRCLTDAMVLACQLRAAGDHGCNFELLGETLATFEEALMDDSPRIEME